MIIFGISFVIFFYIAGYAWYLGGPDQSAPWLYSSAVVCGASLFVLSNIYYGRKRKGFSSSQRFFLSFFDLSTFYCAAVLILWGLVFPILRPIPTPDFQLFLLDQESLAIGLYTGLVLCSLVVIFRVALQFLIARSPGAPTILPTPQLAVVEQVETKDRKKLEDSLSSIRSEIAMLRAEVSSLGVGRAFGSKSRIAPAVELSEDNLGWAGGDTEPMSFPVSRTSVPSIRELSGMENLISNAGPQEPVSVSPEYEPTTGTFQLPDSAKNNPWAFVLSGRQSRVITRTRPIEEVEVPIPEPVEVLQSKPEELTETEAVDVKEIAEAKPVDLPLPAHVELEEAKSEVNVPARVDEAATTPVELAETKSGVILPISVDETTTAPVELSILQPIETTALVPLEVTGTKPIEIRESNPVASSLPSEMVQPKPVEEAVELPVLEKKRRPTKRSRKATRGGSNKKRAPAAPSAPISGMDDSQIGSSIPAASDNK